MGHPAPVVVCLLLLVSCSSGWRLRVPPKMSTSMRKEEEVSSTFNRFDRDMNHVLDNHEMKILIGNQQGRGAPDLSRQYFELCAISGANPQTGIKLVQLQGLYDMGRLQFSGKQKEHMARNVIDGYYTLQPPQHRASRMQLTPPPPPPEPPAAPLPQPPLHRLNAVGEPAVPRFPGDPRRVQENPRRAQDMRRRSYEADEGRRLRRMVQQESRAVEHAVLAQRASEQRAQIKIEAAQAAKRAAEHLADLRIAAAEAARAAAEQEAARRIYAAERARAAAEAEAREKDVEMESAKQAIRDKAAEDAKRASIEAARRSIAAAHRRMKIEGTKMFQVFDLDHDGALSHPEMTAFLASTKVTGAETEASLGGGKFTEEVFSSLCASVGADETVGLSLVELQLMYDNWYASGTFTTAPQSETAQNTFEEIAAAAEAAEAASADVPEDEVEFVLEQIVDKRIDSGGQPEYRVRRARGDVWRPASSLNVKSINMFESSSSRRARRASAAAAAATPAAATAVSSSSTGAQEDITAIYHRFDTGMKGVVHFHELRQIMLWLHLSSGSKVSARFQLRLFCPPAFVFNTLHLALALRLRTTARDP